LFIFRARNYYHYSSIWISIVCKKYKGVFIMYKKFQPTLRLLTRASYVLGVVSVLFALLLSVVSFPVVAGTLNQGSSDFNCSSYELKQDGSGTTSSEKGSVTISSNGRTASWSANLGFVVSEVCVKGGNPNNPGGAQNGYFYEWSSPNFSGWSAPQDMADISHAAVSFAKVKPTNVPPTPQGPTPTLIPTLGEPTSTPMTPIPEDPTVTPVTPTSEDPTATPVTPIPDKPTSTPVTPIPEDPTATPVTPTSEEPTATPVTPTPEETTPVIPTPEEPIPTPVSPTPAEPTSTPVVSIPEEPTPTSVLPTPQNPIPSPVTPTPEALTPEPETPEPITPTTEIPLESPTPGAPEFTPIIPVTGETPTPEERNSNPTPISTLAVPGSSGQQAMLIPVTGGDFTPVSTSSVLREIMFNLGLGFVGLGLILQGIRRRFE
jgi:hypothetical protein